MVTAALTVGSMPVTSTFYCPYPGLEGSGGTISPTLSTVPRQAPPRGLKVNSRPVFPVNTHTVQGLEVLDLPLEARQPVKDPTNSRRDGTRATCAGTDAGPRRRHPTTSKVWRCHIQPRRYRSIDLISALPPRRHHTHALSATV